jgi:uncharacterized protein
VVFAFALVHDSQRQNEGEDPEHGPRAADFATLLHREGLLVLTSKQMRLLSLACRHHTGGPPHEDPTLGVCWDSDRLNLWRVGTTVDPRWISTLTALDEETIGWARKLESHPPTWKQVVTSYQALDGNTTPGTRTQ